MPHYLYDELAGYCRSDAYPFHMPGHKRRLGSFQDPFSFDITEIDGFDNLHHAEGLILEAEQRAARLYGAEETHFLVNGSTAGILSAIGAVAKRGGRILMARNSHKAAYHAVEADSLHVSYLVPAEGKQGGENGGPIRPEDVEKALVEDELLHAGDGTRFQAVYITSPTYDGVTSDVRGIADIAHRFDVPLIVDEAHGAHFGMYEIFPDSSVHLGADLVIHSVHKTLPSMTQTALIHVQGDLVSRRRLKEMLDIFQTSSPSYVLMASIDNCIRIVEEQGTELFEKLARNLGWFYGSLRDLRRIGCIRTDDPSKILLRPDPSAMTAGELYRRLREKYHLQPEMLSRTYVLMLSSVGDDEEGFRRLSRALHEIDEELTEAEEGRAHPQEAFFGKKDGAPCDMPAAMTGADKTAPSGGQRMPLPEAVMPIGEARDASQVKLPFEQSAGRVSGEYLYLYPPGIPLITPGERITARLIGQVRKLMADGYALEGAEDHQLKSIWCVSD